MMYNNKMAVAIKSAGKVLREFGDTVYVPFGTEYSIFIKNLNSKRAKVKITIDNQDVLGGDSLVVDANSEIDLERFIRNGNKKSGNRFKFIERTETIEQHRGIDACDGLIRVEFQYEAQPYRGVLGSKWLSTDCYTKSPSSIFSIDDCYYESGVLRKATPVNYGASIADSFVNNANAALSAHAQAEVGITVPGSQSKQQFATVSDFACEAEKHVIVFKMLGIAQEQVVKSPVTVQYKPKCSTCGKVNKIKNKFCSECGTSLSII